MALFTAQVQAFILHALMVIKLIQGMASLPVSGASWGQQTDESIVVRQGVLFQTKDCPWAMSKAEMLSRQRDDSIQGNTILMTRQAPGRAGNRFVDLSQFLAMGYCCRSKLLELPHRGRTIPDRDSGNLTSGSNLFDFSTVDMMPLEEFRNISDRADVCPQLIRLHGPGSMRLEGIHPDLLSCMNRVYLRGCEAAYIGGLVETLNVCPAHGISIPGESFDKLDAGIAGSLVIHIRSGDVFRRSRRFSRHGQPPLQFYLDAIDNQPWSEVSVITFAEMEGLVNPTYSRLEEMKTVGLLGKNVNFFMNRQFSVDLEAMLCADGIALARSSLSLFLTAHGRASYFYVPSECGPGIYARGVRSETSPRILVDNTTLLALERPDAEVYGIEWKTGPSSYSVYTSFTNTPLQRTEMLESDSIKGLQQCHIGS